VPLRLSHYYILKVQAYPQVVELLGTAGSQNDLNGLVKYVIFVLSPCLDILLSTFNEDISMNVSMDIFY
jgi:hypothetical protein